MMDETVLSFHDTLLKQSDFDLLDSPCWLNDKIIAFYFEYLDYKIFHEHSKTTCFITPDVTQFIKLCAGPELAMFLEPLSLQEKNLVVLAVNNSVSMDTAGGSHWSVLIYEREQNMFSHFDSASSINSQAARQCAEKIKPFLKAGAEPGFIEVKCPQQENGHDCGVYALCFAETVMRVKLQGGQLQPALNTIDSPAVCQWRTDTKKLITALASSER